MKEKPAPAPVNHKFLLPIAVPSSIPICPRPHEPPPSPFPAPDGFEAVYCSRVRSLVDAVYDWSRFNSRHKATIGFPASWDKTRPSPASLLGLP